MIYILYYIYISNSFVLVRVFNESVNWVQFSSLLGRIPIQIIRLTLLGILNTRNMIFRYKHKHILNCLHWYNFQSVGHPIYLRYAQAMVCLRPVSQIPQCTGPIYHNTTFRTEMCTFLFWMVFCGIWDNAMWDCLDLLWVFCIGWRYFKEVRYSHMAPWRIPHQMVTVNEVFGSRTIGSIGRTILLTNFDRNSNSLESLLCCNSITDHQIATNFWAYDDSRAILSCTKLCIDHFVRTEVRSKRSFRRNWIATGNALVKWAPG